MKKYIESFNRDFRVRSQELARNTWVIRPKGSIDSSTSEDFRDSVQQTFDNAQSPSHILLDMADVKYISSVGLGALIGFLKTSRQKQVTFALYDTQLPVRRVLEISKMDFLLMNAETMEPLNPFADYIRQQESERRSSRQTPSKTP